MVRALHHAGLEVILDVVFNHTAEGGTDDNRSWNCGAEGPTPDPEVLALRARQSRAMLTTLLLLPTSLSGDLAAALCEYGSATLDEDYCRSRQPCRRLGLRCRPHVGLG